MNRVFSADNAWPPLSGALFPEPARQFGHYLDSRIRGSALLFRRRGVRPVAQTALSAVSQVANLLGAGSRKSPVKVGERVRRESETSRTGKLELLPIGDKSPSHRCTQVPTPDRLTLDPCLLWSYKSA